MADRPTHRQDTFPPRDPEVFYDLARARFDRLIGAVDSMDAKLAGFLGVGSALLGVMAALYAIKPDSFKAGGWLVLAVSLVAYAFLAAYSLAGMRVRRWDMGPEMEEIYNDHIHYSQSEIKWRASGTLQRLANNNKAAYEEKAGAAKWSPILLAVLAGLMVAAAVTVALQG
jgi:hypothetical protein